MNIITLKTKEIKPVTKKVTVKCRHCKKMLGSKMVNDLFDIKNFCSQLMLYHVNTSDCQGYQITYS